MTADHKPDSRAEHDAVIKAEQDAEREYQASLKKDKAAEPPYVRPLERPHHSLTGACKQWDDSVAAEVAAATKAAPTKETKYDADDEGDELKSKGKHKGKKDDD